MKKLVSVVIISILVLSMFLVNAVYAATECEVEMKPNNTTAELGQTIEVKISVSKLNIDAPNETYLTGIEGNFKFNENVFDAISKSDFVGANSWKIQTYNPQTGYILIMKDPTVGTASKAEDVATVNLKVKSNATVGFSDIKLESAIAKCYSTRTEDVSNITIAQAVVTGVTVNAAQEQNPTPSNPINNNPTPDTPTNNNPTNNNPTNNNPTNNNPAPSNPFNNTPAPVNNSSNGSTSNSGTATSTGTTKAQDTTASKTSSSLPKTGSETILPIILAIGVVGTVALIRYRKMNNY